MFLIDLLVHAKLLIQLFNFILFYILLFYSGHFVLFLFYILACLCACCLIIVFVQTWIDFPRRLDFTEVDVLLLCYLVTTICRGPANTSVARWTA